MLEEVHFRVLPPHLGHGGEVELLCHMSHESDRHVSRLSIDAMDMRACCRRQAAIRCQIGFGHLVLAN
jgi:hypothetical protein